MYNPSRTLDQRKCKAHDALSWMCASAHCCVTAYKCHCLGGEDIEQIQATLLELQGILIAVEEIAPEAQRDSLTLGSVRTELEVEC